LSALFVEKYQEVIMKAYNASRFEGKVALIAGGASGIGRATAERLAGEGAQVIIADRDADRGAQAIADINASGGSAFLMKVDLADEASIESLGAEVSAQFPALHVLVNGAVGPGGGKIETGDWRANWELGTAVSLKAAALTAEVLLPLMKVDGAAIVNISSDGALRGRPNIWIYDAMKAALISLTKTMACEFVSYGVRANAILPGWTVTEMHFGKHSDPEARKREMETMDTDYCLMRRLARPGEIAAAIAFLSSDDASYVTGTILCADGGRVGLAL
jgi:NAD(P)-dependent dehydrogenase (short-subunit alcohol dehydrogenase family)